MERRTVNIKRFGPMGSMVKEYAVEEAEVLRRARVKSHGAQQEELLGDPQIGVYPAQQQHSRFASESTLSRRLMAGWEQHRARLRDAFRDVLTTDLGRGLHRSYILRDASARDFGLGQWRTDARSPLLPSSGEMVRWVDMRASELAWVMIYACQVAPQEAGRLQSMEVVVGSARVGFYELERLYISAHPDVVPGLAYLDTPVIVRPGVRCWINVRGDSQASTLILHAWVATPNGAELVTS